MSVHHSLDFLLLLLLSHPTVQCFHICEELDYQLWVLQAELRRCVARPHGEGLSYGPDRQLSLEGLRIHLFDQIKLLFVQN